MLGTRAEATFLLCRVQARLCGLPLDTVEEILRPQPVRPLAAPVAHVLGLARIRGRWVPVVDLAGLLGLNGGAVRRYVVLRVCDRQVAVAVDEVMGLHRLSLEAMDALPPLLRDPGHAAVAALAARDEDLIALLDTARLLPDDWLSTLPDAQAPRPGESAA
ncbi:chemotaxis protein CheW [Roseateles amylovorans]|uniref:Chemotaxis protein CheW n=1 Tax=Roseateles amylovorans TaxID=2978473 RepID=A0ABY6AWU6_9BURK|nr:chemotaxis protein CheW [Roseateles amylovorans]UXH77347.1 chemotaxis protein CheW [Roseateles amylovorans]